jgi:hypothetical protein
MLLWPALASAQHAHAAPAQGHAVVAPAQGTAVVRGGFYGPYYRPFYYPYYRPYFYPFYSPFSFGFGLYYNSFWGWYPYAGFPFPPYPYVYPPPYYYSGGWASARIEVKPKEAEVYLDGYYVGVVDQFDGIFQRLDIPPGQRELVIYMPGYHTLRERMAFAPGQSYHFKETLQPLAAGEPQDPKPQPDPNAAPPNAPSQYPNAPAPYPNAPAPYPNAPQPPAGQGPYRQPPPPPQGEPRMEPYPQAPQTRGGEFGTLNLRVQPEDAVVTIDGEHWDNPQGGSRLTVQLAPGTHRIEVKKEGFHTYTGTVEIRPGEPQTLNISLPREVF